MPVEDTQSLEAPILSNPNSHSSDGSSNFNEPTSYALASPDSSVDHILSSEASSLMPTNFSSPGTAKKPYKKPKIVLTLSLRSKESAGPDSGSSSGSYVNGKGVKSSFLFGNNVIKFDTRTNRLIIPTSTESLEVEESEDDEGEERLDDTSEVFGDSTVISVITEGPLLEVQNQTLTALKILDKLRSLSNSKIRVPVKPTPKLKVAPPKEPWYGFKKYETLHPRLRGNSAAAKKDEQAQASTQGAYFFQTIIEFYSLLIYCFLK